MGISTHILDTSRGRPAVGVDVALRRQQADGNFSIIKTGVTDADGRVKGLVEGQPETGVYQLRFATGAYFQAQKVSTFFPVVEIIFVVDQTGEHYHVPLLLNPFGFSTYRGS